MNRKTVAHTYAIIPTVIAVASLWGNCDIAVWRRKLNYVW